VQRRGQAVEADGRQAQEVGEDEHRHAFGHAGVAPAGLVQRVVHHEVDVQVAQAHHGEGHHVEHQHGDHVGARRRRLRVHRQADAHLLVAAHADQRQHGERHAQQPARQHQRRRVAQADPPVRPHRVEDGVPALEADEGQRVHGQLAGEHRDGARQVAAALRLPGDGVAVVVGARVEVDGRHQQQVDAHAEVGEGQVTHEEARDGELLLARQQDEHHQEVGRDGQRADHPHQDPQEALAHHVLAGVQGVGQRRAQEAAVVQVRSVAQGEVEAVVGPLRGQLHVELTLALGLPGRAHRAVVAAGEVHGGGGGGGLESEAGVQPAVESVAQVPLSVLRPEGPRQVTDHGFRVSAAEDDSSEDQ